VSIVTGESSGLGINSIEGGALEASVGSIRVGASSRGCAAVAAGSAVAVGSAIGSWRLPLHTVAIGSTVSTCGCTGPSTVVSSATVSRSGVVGEIGAPPTTVANSDTRSVTWAIGNIKASRIASPDGVNKTAVISPTAATTPAAR